MSRCHCCKCLREKFSFSKCLTMCLWSSNFLLNLFKPACLQEQFCFFLFKKTRTTTQIRSSHTQHWFGNRPCCKLQTLNPNPSQAELSLLRCSHTFNIPDMPKQCCKSSTECMYAATTQNVQSSRCCKPQTGYANRLPIPDAPSVYSTPDPKGYEPVHLYLLARHGSRYPTAGRMAQINSLPSLFKVGSSLQI